MGLIFGCGEGAWLPVLGHFGEGFVDEIPGAVGFLQGIGAGPIRRHLGLAIGKQAGCGIAPEVDLNRDQGAGRLKLLRSGFEREIAGSILAQDGEDLADKFRDHEHLAFGRTVQMVVVDGKAFGLDQGPGPVGGREGHRNLLWNFGLLATSCWLLAFRVEAFCVD